MKVNHTNTRALSAVLAEMQRQDDKWGSQRKQHALVWFAILGEEFGEVAQEAVEYNFSRPGSPEAHQRMLNMRQELIQVAAVALQWAESLDVDFYGTHLSPDVTFTVCPQCHGMGSVTNMFGDRIDCPKCGGQPGAFIPVSKGGIDA